MKALRLYTHTHTHTHTSSASGYLVYKKIRKENNKIEEIKTQILYVSFAIAKCIQKVSVSFCAV